jgi:hypothetical protein
MRKREAIKIFGSTASGIRSCGGNSIERDQVHLRSADGSANNYQREIQIWTRIQNRKDICGKDGVGSMLIFIRWED